MHACVRRNDRIVEKPSREIAPAGQTYLEIPGCGNAVWQLCSCNESSSVALHARPPSFGRSNVRAVAAVIVRPGRSAHVVFVLQISVTLTNSQVYVPNALIRATQMTAALNIALAFPTK